MPTDPSCILLVEPDILVRHPLAEYLRGCGYRVLQASTTDEARTLLTSRRRRFAIDVVLADASAPGTDNSFTLATWIRTNRPGIEALLAGSIEAAAAKAGDLCEEGPALEKPYDHRRIADHIRQLMAARDRNRHGHKVLKQER